MVAFGREVPTEDLLKPIVDTFRWEVAPKLI
jgi:hypothetical protein